MLVYKELSFVGDKPAFDEFSSNIYRFFSSDWIKPKSNHFLNNYITADYIGENAPHAEVSIYYGPESWREGILQVGNIVPLDKNQLTIEEYNKILDLFFNDIIVPYCSQSAGLRAVGPTSDKFNPLDHISEQALNKLNKFCNAANKSTGSSHPSDEERWFDFICQTVDDNRVFDYDTLYNFLRDEDYWGKKEKGFLGVMGHFAWSEDMASELASEYENAIRLLRYYKDHGRGKI